MKYHFKITEDSNNMDSIRLLAQLGSEVLGKQNFLFMLFQKISFRCIV